MTIDSWQARIKAGAARRARLGIRGSGSKAFCAPPLSHDVIDTRDHRGIVTYEPEELVIVVRCGTPLAEVESAMAGEGQMLAFEPPHFGPEATIGGAVATGLSGPRRPYTGALRDFVLGAKLIDGKGDLLAFGGRVMKNVAGFDVSRLLAGSFGTLGIITEVAFKCLPRPQQEQTRVLELDADAAIAMMNRCYAQAMPITASTWVGGMLHLRFGGADPAVRAAVGRVGGEVLANASEWWADWREQRHPFFSPEVNGLPLQRVACRASAPFADLAQGHAHQAIEWGGALRWLRAPLVTQVMIAQWARHAGGHAHVVRGAPSRAEAFTAIPAPLVAIAQRLKQSFDPYAVFPSL